MDFIDARMVYDTDNKTISDKIGVLQRAPNEFEWTATAGQLTYTLPTNASYDINSKVLEVVVGGGYVPSSLIQKDSSTQFTLLVNSSSIPAGIKVVARWTESLVAGNTGNGQLHHTTHEIGGVDEIDLTKLKGYKENVGDKIGVLNKKALISVTDYESLKIAISGGYDWSPAIQQAVINANGKKTVYLPKLTNDELYYISSPITAITGKSLYLIGENNNVTIQATDSFTGYMLKVSNSFNIQNITISGNNKDGTYCFGGDSGGHGGFVFKHVKLYSAEYGIKLDGTTEFPVRSEIEDVWIYAMRTSGIKLATDTPPTSGQSCMSLNNIAINNSSSKGIPASNIVLTENVTSTTDSLTWEATNAKEYGWVIMKRLKGDASQDTWKKVVRVSNATTSYTVTKTAGEQWDYQVLRATTGLYVKNMKAVNYGVIQSEYYETGLRIEGGSGHSVGAFYSEWRGNYSDYPVPRGNGIEALGVAGFSVLGGWVDSGHSFVELTNCYRAFVTGIRSHSCSRSAVHIDNNASDQNNFIGTVYLTGGTPTEVTYGTSNYSYNQEATKVTTSSLEKELNHHTEAKYAFKFRNDEKGSIGANSLGSYANLTTLSVKPTSKNFTIPLDSQISRTNLINNVATNILQFDIAINDGGLLSLDFVIKAPDTASVIRQVISGRLNVSYIGTSGSYSAQVTAIGLTKIQQAGTITDPIFTASVNGNTITVSCNVNSSNSSSPQLYLNPVSKIGTFTNIIQL